MRNRAMSCLLFVALAVSAAGCAYQTSTYARSAPPDPYAYQDESGFYNALSPYGRWFQFADYGWVWTPYGVDYDWRPYRDGHWVYSDCGWTWVSDEPWGWATYHYGRWLFDNEYGWVWVPGQDWAPAWVAWCDRGDYVGWAPLPPQAVWSSGIQIQITEFNQYVPAHGWCFVDQGHFTDANLRGRALAPERNVTLLTDASLKFEYEVRGERPFNRGVWDADTYERHEHHPVPRFKLTDASTPGRPVTAGGELRLFRPQMKPMPAQFSPQQDRNVINRPVEPVANDADRQAKQAADERRLQQFYDQRRQQLEQKQRDEESHPQAGRAPEVVHQQHQDEIQALERMREQQKHVLQSRYQKGIYPGKPGKPDKGDRGRGKNKGNDQGDDKHGKGGN